MLFRYRVLMDVYECRGLECTEHEVGHSTRLGIPCNVNASSSHGAKRRAIELAHASGLTVRNLIAKPIYQIRKES